MQRMELPFTLLGVDVVKNKELIANDISEKDLYEIVKANKARIVVTAIGGQGHIFGRGNQQVSPRVIRAVGKENIKVVASRDKLVALQARPLLVDTGDPELDNELCGYTRVTMGWEDYTMYKVSN